MNSSKSPCVQAAGLSLKSFNLKYLLFLVLLMAGLPFHAFGQEATLLGTVTDPAGAIVPNVTITITSVETGRVVVVTTNCPDSLVVTTTTRPVSTLVIVIVTFGTMAPAGSVTVPRSVASWPKAWNGSPAISKTRNSKYFRLKDLRDNPAACTHGLLLLFIFHPILPGGKFPLRLSPMLTVNVNGRTLVLPKRIQVKQFLSAQI